MPRSVALACVLALLVAAPAGAALQPSVLGADPPAGQGILRFPQALAFSPGGAQIWVADQHSSLVQEFARDGTWLKEVGGHADARQTGRIGTVGGLAVDRNGHLYVLDSENDRVQVFATADGNWLGAWGTRGTTRARSGSATTPARAASGCCSRPRPIRSSPTWPTRTTTACSASR